MFEWPIWNSNLEGTLNLQAALLPVRNNKLFKCTECDYSNIINDYVLTHMLTVHDKPYKCSICDFTTKEKIKLLKHIEVWNIWVFFSSRSLKMRENILVLLSWFCLVCVFFEGSVFVFQFLNDNIHNYVKKNIIVHFILQKLKNKHTFLKTERAKFPWRENIVFILLEEIVFFSNFEW